MSQHSGKRDCDASPPPEEQPPRSKARGNDVSMSRSDLEELLAQAASKAAKEALASHGPASSSSVKEKDRKYQALQACKTAEATSAPPRSSAAKLLRQTMNGKQVPISLQDDGIVLPGAFLGAKSPIHATLAALPIMVDSEDNTGMDTNHNPLDPDADHTSEHGSNDGDESNRNSDSDDDSRSSRSGSRASSPSALASGSVDPFSVVPNEPFPNPEIDVHGVRSKRSAPAKPAFQPRIAKFAGPYRDGAFSFFLPPSETADRKKANKELKVAAGMAAPLVPKGFRDDLIEPLRTAHGYSADRAKSAVTELMRTDSDARQLQDEALVFLAPMLDGASDILSFMEEHEAQVTHMIQLASDIPPHEKLLAEWETLDERVKEASYLDFRVWANKVTREATERLLGSISELMILRNGTTQVASRGLNNLVDGLKGLTYHHLSRTNSARQRRIINAIDPTQALKVRPDAPLKVYPVEEAYLEREDHKKSRPPLQLLSGKQLKGLLKQPASSSSSALIALAEAKRKTDTKLGPGSSSKGKATPSQPFRSAPARSSGDGGKSSGKSSGRRRSSSSRPDSRSGSRPGPRADPPQPKLPSGVPRSVSGSSGRSDKGSFNKTQGGGRGRGK
ncbi:hypothetical protein HDU93_000644 [Gonapodya sp. JEL0774]|nr:hypothetical protein HDU93_000644 [Gonapodya sp. JEL0774]